MGGLVAVDGVEAHHGLCEGRGGDRRGGWQAVTSAAITAVRTAGSDGLGAGAVGAIVRRLGTWSVSDEQRRVEMNMSVNRAVAIAAAADQTELRSLYGQAVSHGAANTLCTPEEERAYGTLRLLTLATLRLPDLYLYAHLLEALDEDPTVEPVPPIVTSQLSEIAAGRAPARAPRAGDPRPRAGLRARRVG